MKVKELIELLKELPQESEVYHLWDGEPRTAIEVLWVSRTGSVITADFGEVCYDGDVRPVSAPTKKECACWRVPEKELLLRIL